jgi:hypothetical protein
MTNVYHQTPVMPNAVDLYVLKAIKHPEYIKSNFSVPRFSPWCILTLSSVASMLTHALLPSHDLSYQR